MFYYQIYNYKIIYIQDIEDVEVEKIRKNEAEVYWNSIWWENTEDPLEQEVFLTIESEY